MNPYKCSLATEARNGVTNLEIRVAEVLEKDVRRNLKHVVYPPIDFVKNEGITEDGTVRISVHLPPHPVRKALDSALSRIAKLDEQALESGYPDAETALSKLPELLSAKAELAEHQLSDVSRYNEDLHRRIRALEDDLVVVKAVRDSQAEKIKQHEDAISGYQRTVGDLQKYRDELICERNAARTNAATQEERASTLNNELNNANRVISDLVEGNHHLGDTCDKLRRELDLERRNAVRAMEQRESKNYSATQDQANAWSAVYEKLRTIATRQPHECGYSGKDWALRVIDDLATQRYKALHFMSSLARILNGGGNKFQMFLAISDWIDKINLDKRCTMKMGAEPDFLHWTFAEFKSAKIDAESRSKIIAVLDKHTNGEVTFGKSSRIATDILRALGYTYDKDAKDVPTTKGER